MECARITKDSKGSSRLEIESQFSINVRRLDEPFQELLKLAPSVEGALRYCLLDPSGDFSHKVFYSAPGDGGADMKELEAMRYAVDAGAVVYYDNDDIDGYDYKFYGEESERPILTRDLLEQCQELDKGYEDGSLDYLDVEEIVCPLQTPSGKTVAVTFNMDADGCV